MGWFSRYRHSKGYGVHSPFAFRFITEVLGERLPYYDYERVRGRMPRLCYRMAAYFHPQTVAAAGGADLTPVTLACPRAAVTCVEKAGLIIATYDTDRLILQKAVDDCRVIVLTGRRRAVESLTAYMESGGYGMVFDNHRDMTVIVARRHLPFQVFDVMF